MLLKTSPLEGAVRLLLMKEVSAHLFRILYHSTKLKPAAPIPRISSNGQDQTFCRLGSASKGTIYHPLPNHRVRNRAKRLERILTTHSQVEKEGIHFVPLLLGIPVIDVRESS